MKPLTVDRLMTEYGYGREQAELEVKRANCKHDFGDMLDWTFMGCVQTCRKCGQKQCLPDHCGQHTAAPKDEGK